MVDDRVRLETRQGDGREDSRRRRLPPEAARQDRGARINAPLDAAARA